MRPVKMIWLWQARERRGLTQTRLAEILGKPQSFIAKLESGAKDDVTRTEAVALGKALGVDPLSIRFGRRLDEELAS